MPYTVERGVRSFSDRDTPPEYATGDDEDRDAFNVARDSALADAEALVGVLDNYGEPDAAKAGKMKALAKKVAAVLAEARAL